MKTKSMKLGTQTGSFFNSMMTGGIQVPDVEKGATLCMWTDRHAYFVNWVSDDKRECEIERAEAVRVDKLGMSDAQSYRYDRAKNPIKLKLVYNRGAWRKRVETIELTKEYEEMAKNNNWNLPKDILDQIVDRDAGYPAYKLVEGITRIKKSQPKINISFGHMSEYYDFSF